ncbi:GntR family transcriptional regulator [Mameliella alba]|uniref:GntR family transcriptional regulator n=1 Tax=Mameliella alba TaxID=561184 RepID=UPI001C94E7DB|nr:GntR family transcriptional regulator [Mameliella alba]MBY6120408.1 GntR family transcriptional regulator [Mameliella alba]
MTRTNTSRKSTAKHPPRSDEIVRKLEAEIVDGSLEPGTKLSEVALCERFGVGRAPMREAMRVLESRRLLQRIPYAGMRVTKLDENDIRQLYALREAVEGMACRQAAENATKESISLLKASLQTENRLSEEDVGAVFRPGSSDNGFHETIVKMSGNPWFKKVLLEDLYTLMRTFRFKAAKSDDTRLLRAHGEHRQILDAIASNDGNRAENLMRAHVRESMNNALRGQERWSRDFGPAAKL